MFDVFMAGLSLGLLIGAVAEWAVNGRQIRR